MKVARRLLAAVLLCAGGALAPATAQDDAPGVRARLQSPAVLRGSFVQEKHLQGFRNPLRSRGEFVLVRGRGVIWTTREPFASVVVVNGQRVLERIDGGDARVVFDGGESPAAETVSALLLALVAGDLDALSRRFALHERDPSGASWQLQLLPRDAALRQVFERIELAGDRHVQQVELIERSGDRSQIRFDAFDAAAVLSADEAAQLD